MKSDKIRSILVLICILVATSVYATDYFFSNSGNNSNNGTSSSTPWATLSKLSTLVLAPGDKVLLNSGDVFTVPIGGIEIAQSGTSVNHIVFSSYGTGAKPVITSLTPITSGWTSLGSNIYETNSAISTLSNINTVFVNGSLRGIGRYPNPDATEKGYITYTGVKVANQADDDTITFPTISVPSFVGGKVAIRVIRSNLSLFTITRQTTTEVQFSATDYNGQSSIIVPRIQYGFFFTDHINTLDQFGEWFYNKTTRKLRVVLDGSGATGKDIRASTVDTIFYMGSGRSYIDFDGLSFEGANKYAIFMTSVNHTTISNCIFNNIGETAIESSGGSSWVKVVGCSISNCLNEGIQLPFSSGAAHDSILNNTITYIGMIAGMGTSEGNDKSYNGVAITGTHNTITGNVIDSVGNNGIYFYFPDSILIKNNVIHHWTTTINDGGATYQGNNTTTIVVRRGMRIIKNIFTDANTANEGTPLTNGKAGGGSQGIYMDNWTTNDSLVGNTISNANSGIYCHNCASINAFDNTLYNNWQGQIIFLEDEGNHKGLVNPDIRNFKNKRNILFSRDANQIVVSLRTDRNDVDTFGVFDSNYYCRPIFEPDGINTTSPTTGGIIKTDQTSGIKYQSLDIWNSLHPFDVHTNKTFDTTDDVAKIRFEYNGSTTPINVSLDGDTYKDAIGSAYPGTITLAPFTSAVLMKVANAGGVGLSNSSYNAFESLRKVKITVSLTTIASVDVKVNVATSNGTALEGSDYIGMNKVLVIKAGTLSRTFCVGIVQDGITESAQIFTITLSNPINATLTTSTATVTVLD